MKSDLSLAGLTMAERRKLLSLARARDLVRGSELPSIEPTPREGRVPLSFAQQRLWFLEQLGNLGSTYHISKRQRLRGEMDRAALVRALDRIVARHESLRTTFAQVNGVPEQRIAPAEASRFHLVEQDLEGREDAPAELDRLTAEETRAPFDLERGPLVRGRLIRLAADDHVLLVTMHHIVTDAWSSELFFKEFSALYAAGREGREADLPDLPVQYADYAAWQRRYIEGDVLKEQAEYWKKTLAGAPELLELPTDRPRQTQADHVGARLGLMLDEELTAGIRELGRRHGTTPFMTVLSAWATVLARLSGRDDVVIGSPMAGRGRREIEGLIGFFVNTLALRVDLSGSPTVAEALGRVKARVVEAQDRQDIPFEQVVELVQPARSLSHAPLFQVMFAWENAAEREMELPGLASARAEASRPAPSARGGAGSRVTAKFDLSLTLSERGGRIAGSLIYATALFDRATVERYAGYLRRVLREMVADETRRVERLPILPAEERSRVVEEWNRTEADQPGVPGVHLLFEQQVERTPDAVAVSFEEQALTFAELNRRANRLAHHLRALGVGPDARVGIGVERSLEMVVGVVAVAKAGGAYVPLDPDYPADRLRHMLDDSRPAVLLTQERLRERFAALEIPILLLDADAPSWAARPETDPEPEGLAADHLVYVIYTSGSTGLPKGVMVPHRGLLNHTAWQCGRMEIGAGDTFLQRSTISFDASNAELWDPLVTGARMHVLSQETARDPAAMAEAIVRHGVTVAQFVPTLLQAVMDAVPPGAALPLRRMVCAGEVLTGALAARARDAGCELLMNLYGPTEASIDATWHPCGEAEGEAVPIGRPLANTRVYLLDAVGEPVPVGVAGELYIGGVGVARGYANRPELTAERFVADPFGAEPGARLYRTGDLARWRADGEIDFLGRADHQVKVRGFRIELGEIEARLMEHGGVREAVVVAREDAPGQKRLVAYVVGDETAGADGLRAHLGEALPDYMVPAAYVRLERIPLMPNGKLDRRALPAPEGDAFARRAYEPPAGDVEELLAGIWAEVLRVERVGRWDDFFELGGHSLLAVQVISRVRQVLEVEVALGEMFTRPVLADFARELETAAPAELPPVEPAPREGRVPLSFSQQRLWFLEQLGNLGSTYHISNRQRLRGELDRAALGRALDAIVARHEALRTTFAQVDGIPEQRIAPAEASRFPLVEHDLTGEADRRAALDRHMAEEAHAPFDLERGPLIRGRLLRVAPDDHLLLMTMHHIVSDGWSMEVLTRELGALYAAHREGREANLPDLPVQYADYAAWQRRWVEGKVLQEQADYWTRTLTGAPELLELPTDYPRPAQADHSGARLAIVLDEALTAGLKALSLRHGTTLFMTVLAGWATVLSRLSGQEDVVIGTPTAGRGRREIEGLIGFFVTALALRIDLSGEPTVAELLGRVKRRALEAQHHQDIPFEQVVELVAPVRSLSHAPLIQATLSWQNVPRGSLEMPGLALGSVSSRDERGAAKQDLGLGLGEADGRIVGAATYATALWGRETVERYVGYLRRVLEEMVADDGQRVARLPMLPAEERALVLEEWNATDAVYARDRGAHQLFEEWAARAPDALALAYGSEHLSYAELNRRANRLAHHLRSLGVGPDARVAICVERGPEMVIALLAVLKAGGAYVPLDPEYPEERLRWMIEDSAPSLLLTHGPLAARFIDAGVPLLDLAADAAWAGAPSTDPDHRHLRPEQLAYVIYTSGSTGRPKGAMIQHRNLCSLVSAQDRSFPLDPTSRILQFASFSFDGCTFEVFMALARGAPLQLSGQPGVLAGDDLARLAARSRVTHAIIPPAVLASMPEGELLASIHTLVMAGEAPGAELMTRWAQGRRLLNGYGPTETTVAATNQDYVPGTPPPPPIGRPMANVRVYLLDGAGEPVPRGAKGELFVGGGGVGRGYWGRPALTAERFVPDPFGREPGARLYRTGDLARWNAEGALEFAGRVDEQVKVRGFRIELGEIESRLLEHPAVEEAVVVAREEASGEKRLVAYVVGDEAAGAEALRAHLGERLPDYMVPAAFVRLPALPLTPNGKVDRKALPAPEGDAFALRGYEAPVGETEEMLAGIWGEVLGLERVGRQDDFFELGGHSLLAVQVISRLDVEMDLGELFTHPVLHDFARVLDRAGRAELPPIERVDRSGRVPLSFGQQRLWFLEQLGNLGSTYSMRTRRRLRGELDRAALGRALDALVARHEALRTTFAQVGGVPEQRIAPADAGFALVEHDLAGRADAGAELGRIMAEEGSAPFDLARGPLVRGRLVRMAPDDHVLLMTMHHIVSDDWSMGVLNRELTALYEAFRRGEPDPLPPLEVQYADYAAWQRRWIEGEVLREQGEYWTRTLTGAPVLLELPTDRPRPAQVDHAGARVGVALDGELTAGLKALSRRHGTTLYMTLLAGWATVLSRLSGQDDVVVGSPMAGRGRQEIEGLIGFFVNTLALRVDLAGSPSVAELLGRVKERALEAQRNQDIPFEQVVELVDPERSLSHSPLFQVTFAWQNTPRQEGGGLALPGLQAGGVAGGSSRVDATTDLWLGLWEADGRIVGSVTYVTALFDRETMERHVGYLRRVLEEMAADESRPVARLAIMPESERVLVLEEWNRTETEYPAGSCIHELVEAQVERTPGAEALVFDDGHLVYAELNARANRLAHHLRALGVGPDARVAICVERSPEMIISMLAVLKAGGGYVPLDPSYPVERLRYMLDDSAPRVVLTQSSIAAGEDGLFDGVGAPVLALDRSEWEDAPASNPARGGLRPGHVAYVIYTSGSTGQPKGVMTPHGGLCSFITGDFPGFGVGPGDRVLQFSSFSFDACAFETFRTLTRGASLHLAAPGKVLGGETLSRTAARHGITHAVLPPAVLDAMPEGESLPSIRTMVVAGEAVREPLVRRWAPGRSLINAYGPSETTVCASLGRCRSDEPGDPPIGRPIWNTRIYVLDAAGEPVPPGVAGELFIGGAGVARGYLERPELTAERFVADPFGGRPGARMYRTGDVGRWRADGTLEFVGRNDFQVKIRGLRIELGEIEARLAEHPAVREAVVLAREDRPGEKRLVAYVVGDEAAGAEALRAYLGETLPEYMVPAAYLRMDALPLTPNGKLDRKALPAPEGDAFARSTYEAPVGETERALAGIWSEVLGIDPVGRHDNFFELGGHSLLAVQVVSLMRDVGLPLEVHALFEAPTLAELAEIFSDAAAESPSAETDGADRRQRNDRAIAIRAAGSEAPLFLAYEGMGLTAYAQVLHPHVGGEIPVYALPAQPSSDAPLVSVEEMAGRLVEMLREVQPSGPYRVAGWSFGGVLAYEVAARLIDRGEAVEFVGMFDSYYPAGIAGSRDASHERVLLDSASRTAGETEDGRRGESAAASEEEIDAFARRCLEQGLVPGEITIGQAREMRDRLRVHQRAMIEYRPRPIPVPVHLFPARESPTPDLSRGWRAVVPEHLLRVTPVPGTHASMMKVPNAEALGEALTRAISQAREAARTALPS